jgi:hypothetical protein
MDGHGELFQNSTALSCKEQKCEYLAPEYASFTREVRLFEEGVSIRNETIHHDRRRLLFGSVPCCANANASQPVYDFATGDIKCIPVIKSCIPMGSDAARQTCKSGQVPNADPEFTCAGTDLEVPGGTLCQKCKNNCYRPQPEYACNMYCSNGWTLRRRDGSYGEILATFDMAVTSHMAQYTCQADYTFDIMNGYCEANVCPTENILPTKPNEVTHDCGGGSTANSVLAGE